MFVVILITNLILFYLCINKKTVDFGYYDDEEKFHSSPDGEGTYYITDDIYLVRTSRYMVSMQKDENVHVLLQPFVAEIGENDKFIIIKRYNMKRANEYNSYQIPNDDSQEMYVIIKENEELLGPLDEDEIKEYVIRGTKFKYVDILYKFFGG